MRNTHTDTWIRFGVKCKTQKQIDCKVLAFAEMFSIAKVTCSLITIRPSMEHYSANIELKTLHSSKHVYIICLHIYK